MEEQINFEMVRKACIDLKKKGIKISVDNIRHKLESGSFTTIQRYILMYRKGLRPKTRECPKCRGKGIVKDRDSIPKWDSPDTNKMRKLMKMYNLKTYSLAKFLGISTGTVVGWFHYGTNKNGTIKKLYFDLLEAKMKGIK